jgi:hypothetical protein
MFLARLEKRAGLPIVNFARNSTMFLVGGVAREPKPGKSLGYAFMALWAG